MFEITPTDTEPRGLGCLTDSLNSCVSLATTIVAETPNDPWFLRALATATAWRLETAEQHSEACTDAAGETVRGLLWHVREIVSLLSDALSSDHRCESNYADCSRRLALRHSVQLRDVASLLLAELDLRTRRSDARVHAIETSSRGHQRTRR